MAVDKLVDSTQLDADLTSVANAIRTKGGTSESLVFPTGFVDAIDAIETGGGGDSEQFLVLGGANVFAESGKWNGTQAAYQVNLHNRTSIWCVNKTTPTAWFYSQSGSNAASALSNISPVSIPDGATGVRFYTAKGGQYYLFFVHYDTSTSEYATDEATGWVNVSYSFVEIPQGATHIVAMHRVNSSASSYSYNNLPIDGKLLFE